MDSFEDISGNKKQTLKDFDKHSSSSSSDSDKKKKKKKKDKKGNDSSSSSDEDEKPSPLRKTKTIGMNSIRVYGQGLGILLYNLPFIWWNM